MTHRYSKEQWLQHGIEVLATGGFECLKAKPLCDSLGVTRGSFYWHFSDIEQFHHLLLDRWKKQTTEQIIDQIERLVDASDKLTELMYLALTDDHSIERAIHSWAVHNETVAEAVASVDKIRLEYLCKILAESGVSEQNQKPRAKVIYWAYLGHQMQANDVEKFGRDDIENMASVFKS